MTLLLARPTDALRALEEESAWEGTSRAYVEGCLEDLLLAHAFQDMGHARLVAKRLRLLCANAVLIDPCAPSCVVATGRAARAWERQAAWARWRTTTRTALWSACSGRRGTRASSPPHETTVVASS